MFVALFSCLSLLSLLWPYSPAWVYCPYSVPILLLGVGHCQIDFYAPKSFLSNMPSQTTFLTWFLKCIISQMVFVKYALLKPLSQTHASKNALPLNHFCGKASCTQWSIHHTCWEINLAFGKLDARSYLKSWFVVVLLCSGWEINLASSKLDARTKICKFLHGSGAWQIHYAVSPW